MKKDTLQKPHLGEVLQVQRGSLFYKLLIYGIPGLFIVSFFYLKFFPDEQGIYIALPDSFIVLDGAWRLCSGLTPHVDFYTPLGISAFLPFAGVIKLFGLSAAVIKKTMALIFLLITCTTLFTLRNRMRPIGLILATLWIGLMVVAAHHLGYSFMVFSEAGTYAKVGYSIFFLITLLNLFPEPEPYKNRFFAYYTPVLTGILAGWLFLLKPTFFLASLVAIVGTGVLTRQRPRYYLLMLISFLVFVGAIAVCFHDNIPMMLENLRLAKQAQVRLEFWQLAQTMLMLFEANKATFALLGLGFLLTGWELSRLGRPAREIVSLLAFLTVLCPVCMFLNCTGAQNQDLPTITLIWIILAAQIELAGSKPMAKPNILSTDSRWHHFACIVACVFMALPTMSLYALGVVSSYSTNRGLLNNNAWANLNGNMLKGYYIMLGTNEDPTRTQWNSGLELLKRNNADTGSGLFVLGYVNPFSTMLGTRPTRGTPLWLHWQQNFDIKNYPAPDGVFREVNLVLVPKTPDQAMAYLYGPYIQQNFTPLDQDANWQLLRRK